MPLQISRFFLLGCIWFCTSPIHAQTPLSGCFPNPGAGYECVAKLPTPYNFMTLTCGIDASYSSEAAAMNRFRDDFTDECTVSISPHSWLPPGQLSDPYAVACNGGGHTFMPGDEYGEEKTNLKLADVNGTSKAGSIADGFAKIRRTESSLRCRVERRATRVKKTAVAFLCFLSLARNVRLGVPCGTHTAHTRTKMANA